MNSNGLISAVTNPRNESYTFEYKAGTSLLSRFARPATPGSSTFEYSNNGYLTKDTLPNAGAFEFTKGTSLASGDDNALVVQKRTRDFFTSQFKLNLNPAGDFLRTEIKPYGMPISTRENLDGSEIVSKPYASSTKQKVNDERFGASFLRVASTSEASASRASSVLYSQQVVGGNAADPFSFSSLLKTTTVRSSDGDRVSTQEFNASNKSLTTTSPEGRQVVVALDSNEKVTSSKVGNDDSILSSYDSHGRLSQVTQAGRILAKYFYDAAGRLEAEENGRGERTRYGYDQAGRLTEQTFPDLRKVKYFHRARGGLAGLQLPGGQYHLFNANDADLLTSYYPPFVEGLSTVHTAYTYTFDKKLSTITRPDGKKLSYYYSQDRLLAFDDGENFGGINYYPSSDQIEWVGSLDEVDTSYTYSGDKVAKELTSDLDSNFNLIPRGAVAFEYDQTGRRTAVKVQGPTGATLATTQITYNKDDQPVQVGDMTYTYDPASGRVLSTALGNISDLRTYNSLGELMGYSATFTPASGPAQVLYSYTLVRDAGGRICGKTETEQGVTATYEYGFDLAGRLTRVTKNGAPYSLYAYDANGNRTSGNVAGVPFTATYDAQDRLTTYGDRTYSYNANGELTGVTGGGAARAYTYNAMGQLKSATREGAPAVAHRLDHFGRRVETKVDGVLTGRAVYLDELRIAGEFDAAGGLAQAYAYGSGTTAPDYSVKGGTKYFFVKDHLGSPRMIVDILTGGTAQALEYDEFGQVLTDSAPGFQRYGFAGGIYDSRTKLTKFGAREYDSKFGRWMQKDPLRFDGRDPNLFGYAFNDPINYIDSSGKSPAPIGVAIGAACVGGVALGILRTVNRSACMERVDDKQDKKKTDRCGTVGALDFNFDPNVEPSN